jgi:recombination protein RecT
MDDLKQQLAPMSAIHAELVRMEDQFALVLPRQIPAKKFLRCLITSIQLTPELLRCDRKSLLGAAMKAAQDGLVPDGRYGAIIAYNTKIDGKYVKLAQWQPMILGIYQKLHNSGEIKSIAAHLVYAQDSFVAHQGDDEYYEHSPHIFEDRGPPIGVYAIARTVNGGIYREPMSVAQVEEIRAKSKAPNSPAWVSFWGEMAKKCVVKRLAKRLPLSTDDLDWLYEEDEDEAPPPRPAVAGPPADLSEWAEPEPDEANEPPVEIREEPSPGNKS